MKQLKNVLYAICTLCFLFPCSTPVAGQSWQWGRAATGVYSQGYTVAVDKQGNIYAGGSTNSTGAVGFGSISLPLTSAATTNNQAVWVKYSPGGTPLWAGGTSNGSATLISLTTDSTGDLIVFGAFYTPSITVGGSLLSNPYGSTAPYAPATGYAMYFLAKFTATGTPVWALADGNCYYGAYGIPPCSSPWGARSVATDVAGNIYITSSFAKPSMIIGGGVLTNSDPSGNTNDVFVAKYDASGMPQWARSIGGTGNDVALGLTTVTSGDVYVTGCFLSTSMIIGPSTITNPLGAPPSMIQKAFIARFSPSGTPLWADAPATAHTSEGVSLAADAADNVYMVGTFGDTTFNMGGVSASRTYPPNFFSPNCYTALFLVKISPANTALWGKTISSPDFRVNGGGVAVGCSSVWVSAVYGDTAGIDGHKQPIVPVVDPWDSPDGELLVARYTSSGTFITSSGLNRNWGGADWEADIACNDSGTLYLCSTYDNSIYIGPDTISTLGQYHLMVGRFGSSLADTSYLVTDTMLCGASSLTLAAPTGYDVYLWDDASTLPSRTVSASGAYLAICSGGTCGASVLIDSFHVSIGHGDTITQVWDTAFCLPAGTLTLAGPPGYASYTWSTGSAGSTLPVSASGTYYVTAYNGCDMATDTITVAAHPSPVVSIQQAAALCGGTRLSVADAAPHTTLWSTGDATDQAMVYTSGTYWVQVTDAYGCTGGDTLAAAVDTAHYHFLTHITAATTIALGSSIQLDALGGIYYTWLPNDGSVNDPTINNPVATPTAPTRYTVASIDANGCRDTATVFIDCSYGDVFVPTAFTPNGDGLNDLFRIGNLGVYKVDRMQISDRWGVVLYSATGNKGWDGTYYGTPQDMGTYFYLIHLAGPGNKHLTLKGDVTLIR